MNNLIFKDKNGKQYKRIDKRTAKKLFYADKKIIICACNLSPFSPYGVGASIVRTPKTNDFKRFVNNFEYYNCTNNETGYYSAFYTAID